MAIALGYKAGTLTWQTPLAWSCLRSLPEFLRHDVCFDARQVLGLSRGAVFEQPEERLDAESMRKA